MTKIVSYGYLHGAPPQATLNIDLRQQMRDPHIDPALREMTGLDWAVVTKVLTTEDRGLLDALVESVIALGADAVIALGCAGGRHRSVVLATALAMLLTYRLKRPVAVEHRDVTKPVVRR